VARKKEEKPKGTQVLQIDHIESAIVIAKEGKYAYYVVTDLVIEDDLIYGKVMFKGNTNPTYILFNKGIVKRVTINKATTSYTFINIPSPYFSLLGNEVEVVFGTKSYIIGQFSLAVVNNKIYPIIIKGEETDLLINYMLIKKLGLTSSPS